MTHHRYDLKDVQLNGVGQGGNDNKPRALFERFLEKISPEPNSGCWLWTGALTTGGYGYIQKGRRTGAITASRLSYLYFNGEITKDLNVCHTCDVRCCVNPNHLFLGTDVENSTDMLKKGRHVVKPGTIFPKRVTDDQIADIRSGRLKQSEFAKFYALSPAAVCRIVNRTGVYRRR